MTRPRIPQRVPEFTDGARSLSSMSIRTQWVLPLCLLLALGYLLVFYRLGNGPFFVWDEGLYGFYGQNALFHGKWLHAVDQDGDFPKLLPFSKPPLSLWLVAA